MSAIAPPPFDLLYPYHFIFVPFIENTHLLIDPMTLNDTLFSPVPFPLLLLTPLILI